MMHESLILAALAALGALLFWRGGGTAAAASPAAAAAVTGPVPGALSRRQVEDLARDAATRWPGVDWRMLVAMAWVESSFRPGVIGDDGTSFGLLQVSRNTATWLAAEMGADDHGRHLSDADLLRPEVSMHLAGRYVQWLAKYKGVPRSEEWIVRAYNGGPAWDAPDRANRAQVLANTAHHWGKYQAAKRELGLA